jgi:hypothetical protein
MRELDDAVLERRLREVLEEHLGALPLDLTVAARDSRRAPMGGARRLGRSRGITLLAAAALFLVGGALAAGSGILRLPTVVPPEPAPSVVAVASASPDVTSPSPTPTVNPDANACAVSSSDPSEPIGPLAWTANSQNEDWPATVRTEHAGGGSVQPMPLQYLDRQGDNGSTAFPCVDISWVMADTSEVLLELVSKPPAAVDPSEQWIAYGVVTDEDGDGVPDWRYGFDNRPADVGEIGFPTRGWRTNLHTGQTETGPGSGEPLLLNGGGFRAGLASDGLDYQPDAEFRFAGALETTQGMQPWGFDLDMPFYVWASVIVDGRVMATDYAPDSGWLVATPGVPLTPPTWPGGTFVIEELPIELGSDDEASLPLSLSMTVPDDWTVAGPWPDGWDRGTTGLDFSVVGHPWHGCPDTNEPQLGPSFDDLVSYLEAFPRIDISEIRHGTLDGYRAAYLEYRPADGHFDCFTLSPIPLESGGHGNVNNTTVFNHAWIVDVDGVRLVIAALSDKAPSEKVMSEVRQIVESIEIVGETPSLPPPPVVPDPTPTPTLAPLRPPAAGPVPPNARSWTVTVENESSEPATMFVAEGEGEEFRLVGSATPNVVPAGTSMEVSFLFPAEGPDDGWITVNPRLGEGADVGSVGADNIGMPGKIWIRAEGDSGWVGPAEPE